jgi:adenylate kinase family enzyme
MVVPRRILILGPSGAGKSTLARRLGDRLGLPVVHLDALYWNPGWSASETGLFRARMAEAAARDAWVIEGNYSSHLDLRLPRAEALIWLDLPRYVYFPRAVWRSIRNYGRERGDVGAGNPEQFDWSFFRVDLSNTQSSPTCSASSQSPSGNPRNSFEITGRGAEVYKQPASFSD